MQSKTVEQRLAEVDAYMDWRALQIAAGLGSYSPEDYRQHLTGKLDSELLDTLVVLTQVNDRKPWEVMDLMREQIALARA